MIFLSRLFVGFIVLSAFLNVVAAENPNEPVVLRPVIPGSPTQIFASSVARPATVIREDVTKDAPVSVETKPKTTTPATAEAELNRIFGEGWAPASERLNFESASSKPEAAPVRLVPRTERVAILSRALALFDAGRYAECGRVLESLLEADSSDPMALTLAGASLARRSLHREAANIFTIYTGHHPLDPLGHFHMGVSLHMLGEFRAAADAYWTALLLNPALRQAEANRAQIVASGVLSQKNPEAR